MTARKKGAVRRPPPRAVPNAIRERKQERRSVRSFSAGGVREEALAVLVAVMRQTDDEKLRVATARLLLGLQDSSASEQGEQGAELAELQQILDALAARTAAGGVGAPALDCTGAPGAADPAG